MGFHEIKDSLINFVTGLGTAKDPTTTSRYYFKEMDRNELEKAYRSDWLARAIVDAPAEDATREWRTWQATNEQIASIDALEKTFDLQRKLKYAIIRARLYGGAALVMGVEQGESWEELDMDKVGKDDLKFVVVLNRYELMAGPRIYNVDSPWYTRPEYYTVATPMFGFSFEGGRAFPTGFNPNLLVSPQRNQGQAAAARLQRGDWGKQMTPSQGMVQVHPSRVIEFAGNELPDWRLIPLGGLWGDSVLQTVDEMLKDWGLVVGGLANMVNDAKMDVVKIPGLSQKLATSEYASRLLARFQASNLAKSTVNTLLLDKEEEWNRISTSFSALPQLMREFMTVVAGAGRIPVSRLMGQSPGRGLSASGSSGGESDLRNYYDGVTSQQETVYEPALRPLDEVLIRSALGKFDPNVVYEWNPLYQADPEEVSKIALQDAQTTQIYVNSGLINENALRKGVVNTLIEKGTYQGFEGAIDEFGEEPDIVEARVWSPGYDPVTGKPLAAPAGGGGGGFGGKGGAESGGATKPEAPDTMTGQTHDAQLRTLYVSRDVLNGADIVAWAKEQGFPVTVGADAMHVTIAFSRNPVDWMKAGSDDFGPHGDDPGVTIPAGGARLIQKLGDAIVLLFNSSRLGWRHEAIKQAGASWDHDEYQPHITITWEAGDFDWSKAEPYRGKIVLGPEIFEELDGDWRSTITEDANGDDDGKRADVGAAHDPDADPAKGIRPRRHPASRSTE
jgi:hypothetical protein